MSRQLYAPDVLPVEKEPALPTEQKAGWAPSRSGRLGGQKNLVYLAGLEPQTRYSGNYNCARHCGIRNAGILR